MAHVKSRTCPKYGEANHGFSVTKCRNRDRKGTNDSPFGGLL